MKCACGKNMKVTKEKILINDGNKEAILTDVPHFLCSCGNVVLNQSQMKKALKLLYGKEV